MTPEQWIISNDVESSSKTIWAIMVGAITAENKNDFPQYKYYIPRDSADFGRCFRLLKHFPGWKDRLDEVAAIWPKWGPLIREWDNLSDLYIADRHISKTYTLLDYKIKELVSEGLEIEGWKKTGFGCWENNGLIKIGG